MDYLTYRLIHVAGVVLLLLGTGALIADVAAHGKRGRNRPLALAFHGIGLLVILVSGFGAVAKMELENHLPAWILPKLVIWILFGALVALIPRFRIAWAWMLIAAALAGASAYFALFKPL